MTPSQLSKALEDRISGLLASLAVTNESVMNLTRIAEKHEALLYGTDNEGGMVTRGNTMKQTMDDHEKTLTRLEGSCEKVVAFMESQLEINRSQQVFNNNINRVLYGLAGLVFVILLLIGVADITALHNLLSSVHIP